MANIAVVFQSEQGPTKILADAVRDGVNKIERVHGREYQLFEDGVKDGRESG